MIADLKPYTAYRPAEGGWLGEVPSHWSIRRIKYVIRETDSRSTDGKEQLLRVSQYTGVTQRRQADGLEEPDTRAESLVGYKRVEPNDLVINIMLAWNGSMGVSQYSGIASPAYCVYRLGHDVHPWYFHNLLRSPAYKARIKASSTGVVESRLRLYSDSLYRIEAILPPPAEQMAIVRFLDWANGRLEQAIRTKRKVITLLDEQKEAIIHRAVTRGLNPSAPLKPSGVPWLGDIPVHWRLQRLKFLAHIKTGGRDTANRIDDAPYPFFVRSQTVERIDTYSFDGEAVLTAGDGAGVAKVFHYITGKFDYHQRVYRFSNFKQIDGRFFFFYLKSTLRFEALDASAKSTVDSLRLPLLQNFPTVIPPIEEQRDIVRVVRNETSGLDAAISRLQREIELLREYRTRLVAEVVTGKLDVRDAARQLPEKAADREPVSEMERDPEETAV